MATNEELRAAAVALATAFHEAYERLAPSFGYETRVDTRSFDPESKNGRLMVAVCGEMLARHCVTHPQPATDEQLAELKRLCAAEYTGTGSWKLADGSRLCDAGLLLRIKDAVPEIIARLERTEAALKDAERWNAVLNCARIRILGTAGFDRSNSNFRHVGLELWTEYPDGESSDGAGCVLTAFADAAIAAQQEERNG